jgi:hypothetical protein
MQNATIKNNNRVPEEIRKIFFIVFAQHYASQNQE